jgi:hypothetical protein
VILAEADDIPREHGKSQAVLLAQRNRHRLAVQARLDAAPA